MHSFPTLASFFLSQLYELLVIISLSSQQYPALFKAFPYSSMPICRAVFMVPRVRRWREVTVLRRAMAPGKDVGRSKGRRGRYAVEEQDVIGRGDEQDASAGIGGR